MPPTHWLTNGQIDWYDLAHGHLAEMGHHVPQDGWWVVRKPETSQLTNWRPSESMQYCPPLAAEGKTAELWWTDEPLPETPNDEMLFLDVEPGDPPTVLSLRKEP
jgi:hypothetical protein